MRIGIDVMGGDNAPASILSGAIASLAHLDADDRLILFGDGPLIERGLADAGVPDGVCEIVATTEAIGMDESPVDAVRTKRESSINVMARMTGRRAEAPLDAIISAGNTGALVAAAQMHMRRLPNVNRPGIAVSIPTFAGTVVLIDVGANIEPKPWHLVQYGVMGSVYAERILGTKRPRVALMNVGGEEAKGTAVIRTARDRLRAMPDLEFIGFVEGRGVFEGEADVIITDGVVGNVMLKLAEGLAAGIFKVFAKEVAEVDMELARRLEPVVRRIYAKHDYHEYGGAPLLGANGACFICHGSSEARTISNAVRAARRFVHSGVNQAIADRLGAMEEVPA